MKDKKLLLLSILVLLFVSDGLCQRLEFEHLSNNDGLVSSKVTSIIKDHQGYMWFGTFNGLSRYDGYNFTNYVNDPLDSNSITDNFVRCLFETNEELLIIGFQYNGICVYNKSTETFTRYRHDDANPNSLVHNYVLSVYQDKSNNIWVGTRGGLDRFDIQTKKFHHYKPFPQNNYIVSSISEDENGNLWLYGCDEELCKFDTKKNTFKYINFADKIELPKTFYRGGILKYDSHGNLWIGNETEGLFKFNIRTGNCVPYTVQNEKLKSNTIFSIIEDDENFIWVGTDGGGLYRYDYNTNVMELFEHDPHDKNSLNSNAVYSVYQSEPGIIWVGLYAAGIDICKKNKKKFNMLSILGREGKKLSQKSVLTIGADHEENILIGTDGGGLNRYNRKTGLVEYFNKSNSGLHSNIIKCIHTDKDNNIWLGSYGAGVAKLNSKVARDTLFQVTSSDHFHSIINDHVWSITQSENNKIWMGLLGYGIQVYDQKLKSFEYFPFDTLAVKEAICDIFVIREDSRNRIWIGSQEAGLGYYDQSKKIFVKFPYSTGKPGTINENDISDIFEDSKHNIWIATMWGGLNKLIDAEKKSFISYTEKDGLPSNNIRSILEDDNGNLWLSTDNGISLFKVKENKFINFEMEDGLVNKEFNYNSKLKTKDGFLLFGGIEGLNIFHPDSIHFNTKPPKVIITDFKIFNHSLSPNKKYENNIYLTKSISITDQIELTHKDYVFSIDFAALDYISPNKNKYAYKLDGFDNNWTYVNASKRFATYTNLDPGNYTFRVIACNNDGVWNQDGARIAIFILPPWWKTWWFQFIVLVGVVCGMTTFYYLRVNAIRQRNKTLTEEVRKRTLQLRLANNGLQERNQEILIQQNVILQKKDELERKKSELEHVNKMKDKFFSIIGHDLKGPVKALSFLTGNLRNDWEKLEDKMRKDYLYHIDVSTKKIHNLILSLLEWARTQSGQVKPDLKNIVIKEILQENVELLYQQATQKNIKVQVLSDDGHYIYGDYNMITTVVRNVLGNSIKYTNKGGAICLTSQRTASGTIKISIQDNGVGMEEKILENLFSLDKGPSVKGTENEIGTGLGMLISQEFVQMNNGKIYAESKVDEGTTFFIEFPEPELVEEIKSN